MRTNIYIYIYIYKFSKLKRLLESSVVKFSRQIKRPVYICIHIYIYILFLRVLCEFIVVSIIFTIARYEYRLLRNKISQQLSISTYVFVFNLSMKIHI